MIKSIEIKNQINGEYLTLAHDENTIEIRVRGDNEIYGGMDCVSITLNKTQLNKLIDELKKIKKFRGNICHE